MAGLLEGGVTDHSRRNPTTPAVGGRPAGSSCQQLVVIPHTESARPSSCVPRGRIGRSPSIILNITDGELKSLNGCLPVKTYDSFLVSDRVFSLRPRRRGTRTYLYHDHAERKYIPFPCDLIDTLEDLGRGPPCSISLCLGDEIGVDPTNDRGEPKVRQTCMAAAVNENIGLGGNQWGRLTRPV